MAFNLQAHRGGMGLTVENTLPAFARALEIGVDTLEMDVQVTGDGQVVVAHDRDPQPDRCLDTEPAWPGDPMFPYVRDERYLVDLSLEQLRTVDVGSLTHPGYPDQQAVPGARIPLLAEVLALVRDSGAEVDLSIELKLEAVPGRTAPREVFVESVVPLLVERDFVARTWIESFDWEALRQVRAMEPGLRLAALADKRFFGAPEVAARWNGGRPPPPGIEGYVDEAAELGAGVVSPDEALVTAQLIDLAHRAGLRVIPWTVDDPSRLGELIDLGIDGVITNRPDVVRDVLCARGIDVPQPLAARD